MANRTILQPRSRLSMGAAGSSRQTSSTYTQSRAPTQPAYRDRSMEEQQRINAAVTMREENELLVWKSLERNESLPQTKLHYERDMLFIDSDEEVGAGDNESGGSGGSVEWQEDHAWDSDDHARMQLGVRFESDGWYDPRLHKSVEERLRADAERRRQAAVGSGKAKVKDEDAASPGQGTPRSRRQRNSGFGSPGGTPGRRRVSGGKRAFGSGSGSQGQ